MERGYNPPAPTIAKVALKSTTPAQSARLPAVVNLAAAVDEAGHAPSGANWLLPRTASGGPIHNLPIPRAPTVKSKRLVGVLRPGVLPRRSEHALCDRVGLLLGRTDGDRADATRGTPAASAHRRARSDPLRNARGLVDAPGGSPVGAQDECGRRGAEQ